MDEDATDIEKALLNVISMGELASTWYRATIKAANDMFHDSRLFYDRVAEAMLEDIPLERVRVAGKTVFEGVNAILSAISKIRTVPS